MPYLVFNPVVARANDELTNLMKKKWEKKKKMIEEGVVRGKEEDFKV